MLFILSNLFKNTKCNAIIKEITFTCCVRNRHVKGLSVNNEDEEMDEFNLNADDL